MINWSSFNVVGNERSYLVDAFESGWVSGGSYVEKMEKELQAIYSDSTALSVSNGTAALQLAFQTLEVTVGDHVIVPSFCFQAAGNVLRQLGIVPIFCDIDPLNWNQTVQTIEAVMTAQTVGIVVVHNYGVPAPVCEISEFAKHNNFWLIEDCAEAWFTKCKDKYVGQFGDIATFSMHATKTIACGEGGAILLNNQSLVPRAKLLRSHGLDRKKMHYLHELPGNNYRLSNLLAAVAFAQLEQRKRIILKRRDVNRRYRDLLFDNSAITLQTTDVSKVDDLWAVAVNIKFSLLEISRDQLMALLKDLGIETRPGFFPSSEMPYNDCDYNMQSAVADRLHKNVIVLPCSSSLKKSEIDYICESLCSLIESYRKHNSRYVLVSTDESIDTENYLERFYLNFESGRKCFRYYENRTIEALNDHILTLFIKVGDKVIGYGHLDEQNGDIWLGIAIIDQQVGLGWGKILMSALLYSAAKKNIEIISLRVDRENSQGLRLYKSFGFEEILEKRASKSILMKYSGLLSVKKRI